MVDCRKLNIQTEYSENRAIDIAQQAPDCECEKQIMSQHSPGVVSENERLTRFLFNKIDGSKIHIGNNGKLRPSAFAYAFSKGCSVQREDKASDVELAYFLKHKYLSNNSDQFWAKTTQATSKDVRGLRLTGDNRQLFCIYDTAEEDNTSHAEICASRKLDDEGEMPEARKLILDLYQNNLTDIREYRNSRVQEALLLPNLKSLMKNKSGLVAMLSNLQNYLKSIFIAK